MNKEKIIEMLNLYSKAVPVNLDNPMYGIVSHPLTSSLVVMKDNKSLFLDNSNIEEYVDWRCNLIKESANTVGSIFVHINKPYRITFLEFAKEHLDEKEFGESLSWIWTDTEYPHQESLHRLVDLFKRAKKEHLMDAEEIAKINSLPSIITIYRGLQGAKANKGD